MAISNLNIKKADLTDVDLLVDLRNETLRDAFKLSSDVDISVIEKETRRFFQNHLETDNFVTYLAYVNNQPAGCGSICFYSLMPTYHYLSERSAYIMSMYTRPDYRGQGIAYQLLDLLVKEAKKCNVSKLSLEASPMGRPLYAKYGFTQMNNEMILP